MVSPSHSNSLSQSHDNPRQQTQASKIIIKILIAGTQVFGRAFMQAYKEAVARGGKQMGQAAAQHSTGAASRGGPSITEQLNRKTNMSLDEACQILNVNSHREDPSALQKVCLCNISI